MIRLASILIFAAVIFASCASSPFNEDQLKGDWEMVEWKNVTDGQIRSGDVSFTFSDEQRYSAKLNGSEEVGKYWIAADNLHTVEDGKAEKKVKIIQLVQDTLIFEMNRMGTIEQMVLIRPE